MKEIVSEEFGCLKEFIEHVDQHKEKHKYEERNLKEFKKALPVYRGQESSKWGLETSLERYCNEKFHLDAYNRVLGRIAPSISGLIGKRLKDEDWNYESQLCYEPQNQSFMIYLRHHSFPSPLLDWSESIYIALFFAFFKADVSNKNGTVAVYASHNTFLSKNIAMKGTKTSRILQLGRYQDTDKRHFTQQAVYTVAVKEENDSWYYYSHNKAYEEEAHENCEIKRWLLPIRLKDKVMKLLGEMNITPYTIYGNEEGLMQALAFEFLNLEATPH